MKKPEPETIVDQTIVDQLQNLEGKLLVTILHKAIEATKLEDGEGKLEKLCTSYRIISEGQEHRECHVASMTGAIGASYLGDISEDCYKRAIMTPESKEFLDRRKGGSTQNVNIN